MTSSPALDLATELSICWASASVMTPFLIRALIRARSAAEVVETGADWAHAELEAIRAPAQSAHTASFCILMGFASFGSGVVEGARCL